MKEVNLRFSKLHGKIYNLLKQIYPSQIIKQDYHIKVNGKSLYIDLYIPRLKLAIECDGEQHDSFNKFFHQDVTDFMRQKGNDKFKEEYCEVQGITLVRVKYKEDLSVNDLLLRIKDALGE